MAEHIRDNYFYVVRLILVMVMECYISFTHVERTEASGVMLLLLALFLGGMIGAGVTGGIWRWVCLGVATASWAALFFFYSKGFWLLFILLVCEGISSLPWKLERYVLPLVLACIPMKENILVQVFCTVLIVIIYIQQDGVIQSYRKQISEDSREEQRLKHTMTSREQSMQEELNRSFLVAENQMLEEKARLAQVLHDRLGHNINGSIYQLEAVKVLLDSDKETSEKMIQAVIDQLRTGMDEIRQILRRERPSKHKLAMVSLSQLCEKCRSLGVEAELTTEGNLNAISDSCLEVILDNAVEAVSNALKYSKCTKIEIMVHVMNQVVRCCISDNGVGCETLVDGMGIAGMRRRIRSVNGVLDFHTEAGFTINMLIPDCVG